MGAAAAAGARALAESGGKVLIVMGGLPTRWVQSRSLFTCLAFPCV
jgi:hypothetical protein